MSMDGTTRTDQTRKVNTYIDIVQLLLEHGVDLCMARYHLIQLLCEGGFEALQTLLEHAQISTCLGETPSQGGLVKTKSLA